MDSLVSVVTPFHNTAEFLGECIESVLAQSYENWEYILLNNASTDGGDALAADYARRDPRIKLLHTETLLPQIANYNHALSFISPESAYTKIVQADDWAFDDCLARMVALAEANPSVGIVSAYTLAGIWVWNTGLSYRETVFPGAGIARRMLMNGEFYFGNPTSLLYRSRIVRERAPFFSDDSFHEDTQACYEILRDWDFGFVHRLLTFVRTDNGSILTGVRELDPGLLERHVMVGKYGPGYLSAEEYETVARTTRQACLRQLARLWVEGSRKELWQYYRSELASIGYDLRAPALARAVAAEVGDRILNPKRAAVSAFRWLRRRLARPTARGGTKT